MNDDSLLPEMERVASQRWEEHDAEFVKSLFDGAIEGHKIYVYKVTSPADSAQALHEAYRQAARQRLYWHRLRLVHTTLLLICCGLIGLFSLFGWLPKTSAVCAGIAGLIALVLLWSKSCR